MNGERAQAWKEWFRAGVVWHRKVAKLDVAPEETLTELCIRKGLEGRGLMCTDSAVREEIDMQRIRRCRFYE